VVQGRDHHQGGLFAATPGYTKMSTSLGGSSSTGGPALATGTFDHLTQQGSWPAATTGRWTGQDIHASTDNALSASAQGFTRTGSRFTVSGSGDIAPAKVSLFGICLSQAVVAIVAVTAVSGEYSTGMIRLTLAAMLYIQATTDLRALPLTPWQGLGVLAAWAAGALLAGGLLLRFRDA
jgi:hypothetical protein